MSRRVSSTEAIRAEIDALFTGDRDLVEVLEDVARLGARLIIQTAMEAEVDAFPGRARYERATASVDEDGQTTARPGHRNGHCPTTIKTTAGSVTVTRPKLRGTTEKFASRLFGTHATRTNALETLVIASFIRGMSVRDVENALADALGPEAALSKSTVSVICTRIRDEFDAWHHRDLSGVALDHLFLDASHVKMHDGHAAEPVPAARGITTDGKPVFAGLDNASSESTDAWHHFLTDPADHGPAPPLLVISDGAKGLISAAEQVFPKALRQRCTVHKLRNVLAKTGKDDQEAVHAGFRACFDTSDEQLKNTAPGRQLAEAVQRRIDTFIDQWAGAYPAAMRAMADDRATLTVYLRFPAEHHKRIRHSNFIEQTFGETRRRVKAIGRFPGETSCVSLIWAVLDRATRGWHGLTMTPKALRTLQDLRRALLEPPTTLHKTPAETAAALEQAA